MTDLPKAVLKVAAHANQFVRLLLLIILCAPLMAGAQQITGVDRIVAISDVHGAYDSMLRTLTKAGVIDGNLNWSGGQNHLVITGDLLDRGADSRKVLDLLIRLQEEARAAGGNVHALMGNHEVMNLVGDLRYVSKGEYAAFADDEDAEERERWFEMLALRSAGAGDPGKLRADFDDKAPPGFFGHRRAFRPDGEYGAWLLGNPLMVVINGTAFVHGGISPMATELGLDGINTELKSQVARYAEQVAALSDAGLLPPLINFYDHPKAVRSLLDNPEVPAEIAEAARIITELNDADVHDQLSPLWYRGNVGCGELVEGDRIDAALQSLNAERVVIGHTPTLTRQVLTRLDGRVIEIDTGMLRAAYHGSGHALVIEGDTVTVVEEEGGATVAPLEHPRRVGMRDADLNADELEQILANGAIAGSVENADGQRVLTLTGAGGQSVKALFAENPRKGVSPDLAAYRLDRMLQLDMVPVTVVREVDGDMGSVQFVPDKVTNEEQRSAGRRGSSGWCPLTDQWGAMYMFDALIFNPGRSPQQMLYSPDNWQMLLVGHQKSFTTKGGRPPWLEQVDLQLNESWRSALGSLSDQALQENLADVLDKRRIKALGKRRDSLLEL